MMSMSGGWFFVVASEAITVGDTTVKLPGIGSWLAVAIARQDFRAQSILGGAGNGGGDPAYDRLLFRPLVTWADRFRFEQTAAHANTALMGLRPDWRRGKVVRRVSPAIGWAAALVSRLPLGFTRPIKVLRKPVAGSLIDRLWLVAVLAVVAYALWQIVVFTRASLSVQDLLTAIGLGLLTLLRVAVLIALASIVWVPIGVWIGLRSGVATRVQPVAQFLAAFPANYILSR